MHLAENWGARFTQARNWDEATRVLMLAGKALPQLEEQQRVDEWAIAGCESPVWLKPIVSQEQTLQFFAYSPGKIVRGLVHLVLEPLQHNAISDFRAFDLVAHMSELELKRYLSPSRTNGVGAVVEQVQKWQGNFPLA